MKSYATGTGLLQPLCHEDERSALLQFKESLFINEFASVDPSAYPKIESWKLDGNTSDCCSWDGVECDHDSGRVIGLDLSSSFLYGSINSNSSLFSLVHLQRLNLAGNDFNYSQVPTGTLPFMLGKLSKLTALYITDTKVSDVLPQCLANLTHLSVLVLSNNELLGEIPSWLLNLTRFTSLDLSGNHLYGMFPSSISQLKHLEVLDLASNSLSGKVELDIFQNLQNLTLLNLSGNKLMMLTTNSSNATLPKLSSIGLASCNLKEFPDFLRFQDDLEFLNLANNNIQGPVPTWLWNTSKETMSGIDLHGNFLTGIEQHPDAIPWRSLRFLDFSFNRLQGPLPLPPPTIIAYIVAGNLLTGEVPRSFCQDSALFALDVSNNYLSGTIPQCLSSSTGDSLALLNMSMNNFHGTVPQTFMRGIKMIDLSQNQLHGGLPRSLANCTMLEILVLGDNQIEDTFPFWLGTLPQLEVLVL